MAEWSEVAAIKCSECKVKLYNLETGKLDTYEGPDGQRLPVMREGPPPCESCPKGGPENEKRYKLSWRNWKAYELYRRLKTTKYSYELPPHLKGDKWCADLMVEIESAINSGRNAKMERMRKKSDDAR